MAVSPAHLLIAQPPEGAPNQSGQLACSAIDGLVQGRCLIRDRDRLAAFEAGFYHATHVDIAAFPVAVLIAQLDLHSRDMINESAGKATDTATVGLMPTRPKIEW